MIQNLLERVDLDFDELFLFSVSNE